MHDKWLRSLSVPLIALGLGSPTAYAQLATRSITPIPSNDSAAVALAVTLDQAEPRIGSTVSICFQASKPGYVTLWDISTDGQVVRVFPNQYSKVGPAAQIEGGHKYCAGTSGDPFRFRVDGPAGFEDLYLLWTTRTDLQPTGTNYADAQGLVQDLQRLGGANGNEWGTSKVTYDIVPAGGSVLPVVPQQQVSGNVTATPAGQTGDDDVSPHARRPQQQAEGPKFWVLAMGANVEPLTKSNQDAKVFTNEVVKLFSIPKDHVRFLANGKNADFVAGMDWLSDAARPQDFVFIYFSGHGYRFKSQYSEDGWDEALVPYDFQSPKPDFKNLIASQRFSFLINRLQTKNVISVIDSCHSAGVTRGLEGDVLAAHKKYFQLPAGVTDTDLAEAVQATDADMPRTRAAGGRNRIKANGLLLAASHRDQYAIEASGGSLFTMSLVQEMGSKAGGTLIDVFKRTELLTEKVSGNKQDPEAVGDFRVGRQLAFSPQ